MRTHSNRGFSLVEVMFAVFMSLVCALVFSATIPIANRSREKARLNDVATALASKQLERIVARGYGLIDEVSLAQDRPTEGLPRLIEVNNDGTPKLISTNPDTYSFTTIDAVNGDSPSDLLPDGQGFVSLEQTMLDVRRVVVQVTWRENGRLRTVRIGSLVSNV